MFLWRHQLAKERIEEDDMSGPQSRLEGLPRRRLQSHAQAVHSAARLPGKLVSELVSSQYPVQDPRGCQKLPNLLQEHIHLHMMGRVTSIPRPKISYTFNSFVMLFPESLLVSCLTTPFYHLTLITSQLPLRSYTRLFRYVSERPPPLKLSFCVYYIYI